jgi:hypothetical protein
VGPSGDGLGKWVEEGECAVLLLRTC